MSTLRVALVQTSVCMDKEININKAVCLIEKAKKAGAELIILPESFNSPYGTDKIPRYAESIPIGETSQKLSNAAKNNEIFVIGGTIPEKDEDKFFNTCVVWNSEGELIAKFRKIHLFDIDIKNKLTFRESDTLSAGSDLAMVDIKNFKIGIGICYDLRFEEFARIYRNNGCNMLVYPAAFSMTTGPLHWQLLGRARANDTQSYVACVSPAGSQGPDYITYGHTQLIGPWGDVLAELDTAEDMIIRDIDLKCVDEARAQIPIHIQRRTDLYGTIWTDEAEEMKKEDRIEKKREIKK